MAPPVLDTMVLQAFVFGHPDGGAVLLDALAVRAARFPAEVYNADEDQLPPGAGDGALSEFARGIRYARRKIATLPQPQAERFATWLRNARQLPPLLERGSFYVDPLDVGELPQREALSARFGIGRGEAACLTLALRQEANAVFLSSDAKACKAARDLGVAFLTVVDVLESWVGRVRPAERDLDALIDGLAAAKFSLGRQEEDRLRAHPDLTRPE